MRIILSTSSKKRSVFVRRFLFESFKNFFLQNAMWRLKTCSYICDCLLASRSGCGRSAACTAASTSVCDTSSRHQYSRRRPTTTSRYLGPVPLDTARNGLSKRLNSTELNLYIILHVYLTSCTSTSTRNAVQLRLQDWAHRTNWHFSSFLSISVTFGHNMRCNTADLCSYLPKFHIDFCKHLYGTSTAQLPYHVNHINHINYNLRQRSHNQGWKKT